VGPRIHDVSRLPVPKRHGRENGVRNESSPGSSFIRKFSNACRPRRFVSDKMIGYGSIRASKKRVIFSNRCCSEAGHFIRSSGLEKASTHVTHHCGVIHHRGIHAHQNRIDLTVLINDLLNRPRYVNGIDLDGPFSPAFAPKKNPRQSCPRFDVPPTGHRL